MLQGKRALITGATRGLGASIAEEYAKQGCDLILVGRSADRLAKLEESLCALGVEVQTSICDLRVPRTVLALTDSLKDTNVDILVNCAGVFPVKGISEVSLEEYDECMNINVRAPFLLIRELSKNMVKNNWGRIINIASSSAYGGSPLTSIYCASKHALLGLSRSLYKELKGNNVRVICVSPGSIKTDMGKKVEALGQTYDTFMEPEEVAKYVVYNSSWDGNMVSEEVRLNRVTVQ
tara:strand:+ start:539 stop:1246 length:708 start_codon:yes stop_codon:yes gene_type:complete